MNRFFFSLRFPDFSFPPVALFWLNLARIRVIMKKNRLWPVFGSSVLPPNGDIHV